MSLSDAHRDLLPAHLEDLRRSPIPIDMPKIERILIALLEVALAEPAGAAGEPREKPR
jgi:hypothetical protein